MALAIAVERRLGVARIELRSAEAAKYRESGKLMVRRHRSRRGWSRCGRSTESRLPRSGSGLGRWWATNHDGGVTLEDISAPGTPGDAYLLPGEDTV